MKPSFKLSKNLYLCLALVVFSMVASQAYALGSTPVKVVNAEELAKAQGIQRPFRTTISCRPRSVYVEGYCEGTYTVPDNQRLIIEYISMRISLPVNYGIEDVYIRIWSAGTDFFYYLMGDTPNPYGEVMNSQLTRIYAEPGDIVFVRIDRHDVSPNGSFSISGQLIDVP